MGNLTIRVPHVCVIYASVRWCDKSLRRINACLCVRVRKTTVGREMILGGVRGTWQVHAKHCILATADLLLPLPLLHHH